MIHFSIHSFLFMSTLLTSSCSYYNRELDKADNVLYMYPNNGKSSADLEFCEEEEPCGIVTKRYWLPRLVMRPCKCKNLQCNTQYSPNNMKINTVQLDNRSQFKMCDNGESDRESIKTCAYGAAEIGVTVEETRTLPDSSDSGVTESELLDRKIYVHCRCIHGYWQLSRHTLDKVNVTREIVKNQYHCNRLSRCKKGDFCGHVREDTYSAYYRCSCPQGSLCISVDKTLRNASELLYEGPMYRAYCQSISSDKDNNLKQD